MVTVIVQVRASDSDEAISLVRLGYGTTVDTQVEEMPTEYNTNSGRRGQSEQ